MDTVNFKYSLGETLRDTITNFTGVVVARTQWLHGCTRYSIQPRELKDGKPIEQWTFDEPQLIGVEAEKAVSTSAGGGPHPEPSRR